MEVKVVRRSRKKSNDEEQIEELIASLRICSQCSSCGNCMMKPMKDEYDQEFGESDFTCRSALMDEAAELLCYLLPCGRDTDQRVTQGVEHGTE